MAKSSSIYTRVEPELKEQAEQVLLKLGMPMASAINIFLHQIVLHDGIPFDVRLPKSKPLDYHKLSNNEFDMEIEKGIADLDTGLVLPSKHIRAIMRRKYKS